MARFSQQMLKGLLNPAYQQELGQVGRAIGGAPGRMMTRQATEKSQAEIQELLQQHANNPAKLQQLANEYRAKGNTDAATAFTTAATQATAKETTGQQRGIQGGLTAITQGAMRGVPLTSDKVPDLRSAVQSVIQLGGTQEQIIAAYKAGLRGGDVKSSRSGGQYRDKDNNIYELSIQRTPDGEGQVWLPITKGAPSEPVGKVTPIGGAYSETAEGKKERDIDTAGGTTEAEQFAKLRIEAVDSLPQIESTIYSTEQSLELLDQIKRTGGFSTAIVRAAQKFLGVEPKTEAEFNLEAGKQVLAGLNSFEGAISEGERNYLESLYQDLTRSKGANRGILEVMMDRAQRALRDARTRATSNTFDEYMTNRESYGAPVKEPNRRVSWEDMSRGS